MKPLVLLQIWVKSPWSAVNLSKTPAKRFIYSSLVLGVLSQSGRRCFLRVCSFKVGLVFSFCVFPVATHECSAHNGSRLVIRKCSCMHTWSQHTHTRSDVGVCCGRRWSCVMERCSLSCPTSAHPSTQLSDPFWVFVLMMRWEVT